LTNEHRRQINSIIRSIKKTMYISLYQSLLIMLMLLLLLMMWIHAWVTTLSCFTKSNEKFLMRRCDFSWWNQKYQISMNNLTHKRNEDEVCSEWNMEVKRKNKFKLYLEINLNVCRVEIRISDQWSEIMLHFQKYLPVLYFKWRSE
jgi:uncharacterized membrane protein